MVASYVEAKLNQMESAKLDRLDMTALLLYLI